MKPEQLLDSLDHVGGDLLAAAEQTVHARKHRPWAGAAAAALLMLAVGIGGAFLWRSLRGGASAAPGDVPPTDGVVETTPPRNAALPVDGTGLVYERSIPDLERWLAADDWTGQAALTHLPVYRCEALGDVRDGVGAQTLRQRLEALSARFGFTVTDTGDLPLDGSYATCDFQSAAYVRTDWGELTLYNDGRVVLCFDEAHRIRPSFKAEIKLEEGVSEQEVLRRVYRDDLAEQLEALLGLPRCKIGEYDDWDPMRSSWHCYTLWPERSDPAQRLLSRSFEAVQLLTSDGCSVQGFALEWGPAAETSADEAAAIPACLRCLGDYPILSLEEAREQLRQGNFLSDGSPDPAEAPDRAELIYPVDGDRERFFPGDGAGSLLLPYYRFWFRGEDGRFHARYVPAVDPSRLADWRTEPADPPDGTEEATPTESAPPIPGETSLLRPVPVQREDGSYVIEGPAGQVEALHYMGFPFGRGLEPVWADLNHDGIRELVYLCSGPTSGLFTVGVCVYGLEQGWPVVKDAPILNLSWGELSLTEEDGQLWLNYAPTRWENGRESTGPAARYALSWEDGALRINGGALPEGMSLWSTRWSLYGSSFARLTGNLRNSGYCRLQHWECLVWQDPAQPEGSFPQLWAAVSSNGVTVTGLLCWELESGLPCTGMGIEAIEPPEDPAALEGLPMTELTRRYGPPHFDLGSGLYIPCWFTQDGRLLMVWSSDRVERAELRALNELDAPCED